MQFMAHRKSKKKPVQFYIDLMLYGVAVFVIITDDVQFAARAIKHHTKDDFSADDLLGDGLFYSPAQERKPPVIWLERIPKDPSGFGTLAHECLHLANWIGKRIGIEHTIKTEEFYAHIVGYVVEQILTKANDTPTLK